MLKTIGNGKYQLNKKIGEGSFGVVFLAVEEADKSHQLAIKAESIASRFPQLLMEF